MIDHLLQFADEATAQGILRSYYDLVAGWRLDICIPGVVTYSVAADGKKTASTNWYIWVASLQKEAALVSLPNCVLVLDRDAAAKNVVFVASDTKLDQLTLSTLFFQPVNAGTSYLKSVGKQDILKDPTLAQQGAQPAQADTKVA